MFRFFFASKEISFIVLNKKEADYCIQCGNCYYACPSVQVNQDYLGPAALVKAFRFNIDKRDNAKIDRLINL